jgi:hypothetical protein
MSYFNISVTTDKYVWSKRLNKRSDRKYILWSKLAGKQLWSKETGNTYIGVK